MSFKTESEIQLWQGDCLELMKNIENHSIDCVICDLPYGVTQNRWDVPIPLDMLWEQYIRVIKDNGVIILFGQDKFTAKVMLSNEKMHRYNLIWDKVLKIGHLNAKRMPLRNHEDIMIFYKKPPVYNPQKYDGGKPSHPRVRKDCKEVVSAEGSVRNYGTYNLNGFETDIFESTLKYPGSILTFQKVPSGKCQHPTQKPVPLIEWLIRSYTCEGATVLDNCMGSGTTGVACKRLGRNFIGIELEEKYYQIACERIREAVYVSDVEEENIK